VVKVGVTPSAQDANKLLTPALEAEPVAARCGKWGCSGLRQREWGFTQATMFPAELGAARTHSPCSLALEQQAQAASSALFPQPEAPPSLSESNDFLKMDSFPSPSCN
jgi:hypothetical protein